MRLTRVVVGACWGAFVVMGLAAVSGVHVNATNSMPRGLWLQHPLNAPMRDGEVVAVCLDQTEQTKRYVGQGSCPNGLEPMLKTIGAVAGDILWLQPSGATVNGVTLANTAALATDSVGRTLTAYPHGYYVVEPGQVFLFSSHSSESYDSRYLGPIDTSQVIAIGKPVFTF